MTKVLSLAAESTLSPSQEKVLGFLKLHPYEVFAVKEDEKIAQALGMNKNNVGWCLWALEKRHLVAKRRIGKKVYYGSYEAISLLDRELSKRRQQ